MEVHDHEPSYYEVALTNRQVVTGFVILLVCLFGAFLAGVWLGRDASASAPATVAAAPIAAPAPGEKKLEQLTFFGDRAATPAPRPTAAAPAVTPPPAPERAAPTPAELESEKLRATLEAEMAQHRSEAETASASTASAAPAPVGTRLRRKQERDAAAPAATTTPAAAPVAAATTAAPTSAGSPIWIQVYSSSNGAKAQELATRLRGGAFQVVVLEAAGAGGSTYRVRVGPYAARDAADRAASRLRREYRLDTWVTEQP